MSIKTPEQIAIEAMEAFTFVSAEPDDGDNDVEEVDYYFIRDQIAAAIEADRAQHKDRLEQVTVHAKELDDPALRCDDCGDELCTAEEGDTVAILAAVALTHGDTGCTPRAMCDNCDERIEPYDMHAGDGMCGSCNHNAARSGA